MVNKGLMPALFIATQKALFSILGCSVFLPCRFRDADILPALIP
jgi:hypothetical protein